MQLDPNRPHNLHSLIHRMHTEVSWRPTWADVCQVREYIGEAWPKTCGNTYAFTASVLYYLADVEKARAAIAPYMTVPCLTHNAAIGAPCAQGAHQGWRGFHEDLPLPKTPGICTWRVLSKHGQLSATAIFERQKQRGHSPGTPRDLLLLSTEFPESTTARLQYRDPQPLLPQQLIVSNAADWIIHDVRIDGTSIFAPHLDLPGELFSNTVMGPQPQLPIIKQDQWIEIEVRRAHSGNGWFRACIMGNKEQENTVMEDQPVTATTNEHPNLRRAYNHMEACEAIRTKLALPIEALDLIDRTLRDSPEFNAPHTLERRSPLRLLSERKIKRTNPITDMATPVHVRPQTLAMRIEEIEILSKPDHWMIADILVGMRSQFPQAGPPLPGRLFTPGGTCHRFITETVQVAMEVTLLVHYVGPEPEGGIFEAVAMGSHTY